VKSYVVDASVAIKWFIPEIHHTDAIRLVTHKCSLIAPSLIFPEVANVLWKKVRSKELVEEEAREIYSAFQRFDLMIYPSEDIIDEAWSIAFTCNRTIYDSIYLALAIGTDSVFVTADHKFYRALSRQYEKHMKWVGDL
jgi:predicted nucleic acid-binding protein